MAQMSMTADEREAFLAEVRIGVLAVERPDGPPLVSPIWYRYSPGGAVEMTTEAGARKAVLAAEAGRATLCVQREEMPPAYVTVEGPVVLGEAPRDMRVDIASRYLGAEMGEAYVASTEGGDDTALTLTPERWRTVDFSKMEMPG
jgi:PPOX class probable F420-dependent enzyme